MVLAVEEYERLRHLEKAMAPTFADLLLAMPRDDEEFERLSLAFSNGRLLMFLIDTDVLSALRKQERSPDVVRWTSALRTTDLYLSVVSIGEVERGIVRQQHRDPGFARVLATMVGQCARVVRDRILAVDLSTARRWGRLSGAIGHEGADLLIAATALKHGLTVVTRNVRHFERTGVPVLDPFVPHG